MSNFYPLRFRPIFRQYLWGGRRLGDVLGKPIGEGDDYAESWEIVDHGDDQSVVRAGAWKDTSLGELCRKHREEIFGPGHCLDRFPLLFKFLDCQRNLSVQVHPNDQQGAQLSPPDLGKTEAWVILDAAPGSKLYAGLKRGFDRDALAREVARGTTELCLHAIEPRPGDCVFIPAGTVHALGAGLLVAEIQQSSDTTFRLFDWNRVGPDGQPRQLHVTESLDTIDYQRGPVEPQIPTATAFAYAERLVECDKFVLDRWHIEAAQTVDPSSGFHLIVVLQGSVSLERDPLGRPLDSGETALLPAAAGTTRITPHGPATLLDIYLPTPLPTPTFDK